MKPKVRKAYRDNGSILYESYRVNGKYHRIDGPAFICYNEDGSICFEEYWIKEEYYTKDKFLKSYEYNRWLMEQEILKELS